MERLLGRPLRAGEVVLDPGCGTGWQAAGLRRAAPEVTVVGVDLSAGMLGKARAAGAGPLLQADATRLPLAAGSVDVVVTRGVLHHLPDVVGALADWRRVLRPGGAVVVVSEPTPTVEKHGEVLVRALLPLLRRPLTPTEDFWELASMAANLRLHPGRAGRPGPRGRLHRRPPRHRRPALDAGADELVRGARPAPRAGPADPVAGPGGRRPGGRRRGAGPAAAGPAAAHRGRRAPPLTGSFTSSPRGRGTLAGRF